MAVTGRSHARAHTVRTALCFAAQHSGLRLSHRLRARFTSLQVRVVAAHQIARRRAVLQLLLSPMGYRLPHQAR